MRNEFLHGEKSSFRERVENVLITFGGTDSSDLTSRMVRLLGLPAASQDVVLFVLPGPGYMHRQRLDATILELGLGNVIVSQGTKRISDYMAKSDFAISATGRTLYELAHMRVPAMALANNEREEKRPFACLENGFINLGRSANVSDERIVETFRQLLIDSSLRRRLHERMVGIRLTNGVDRVMEKIRHVMASQPR